MKGRSERIPEAVKLTIKTLSRKERELYDECKEQ